jgi:AcrR family transcriptional regulator
MSKDGVVKQGEQRPYHHGELRRALLDAALQLVAERGRPDFTLREVARQAGVSHNAPYNHFADKADLVAALTVEGFQKLEVVLRSAYAQSEGTPFERILALSGAYLRFALDQRAAYSLLFRPELRQSSHNGEECDEAVKRASTAAFQVLLDGLAAAQQAGEIRTDRSVELLVLAMWSTMHGMTALLSDYLPIEQVDHLLREHKAVSSREKVEQLMAHVIQVTAQGLMIRREEPTTPAASLEEPLTRYSI